MDSGAPPHPRPMRPGECIVSRSASFRDGLLDRLGCALVKKDFHPINSGSRLAVAKSRTVSTCFRSTPGNHSKNWSMVAPSSKFSNKAFTGTRVPQKTHAPPTRSGRLSTAEHVFQLIISVDFKFGLSVRFFYLFISRNYGSIGNRVLRFR